MPDVESLLVSSPLLWAAIWIGLYISDYYLTIWGAKLYRQGANEHLVVEGSLELTTQFQADVDRLRLVSPRFIANLAGWTLLLGLFWWLFREAPQNGSRVFLFIYGGFVFMEGAVHLRHFRNIATYRRIRDRGGVEGRVRTARWTAYSASWVDLLGVAALLLAAAVVANKALIFGGAAMTFGLAMNHRAASKTTYAKAVNGPRQADDGVMEDVAG